MKRRLTKLVVFVLLGAVVNVAVAWGCALWSGSHPEYSSSSNHADFGYGPTAISKKVEKFHEIHIPFELDKRYESWESMLSFGYRVYTKFSSKALEDAQRDLFLQTFALYVGWPASSLASYRTYYYRPADIDAGLDPIAEEWESGLLFVVGDNRWIPFRPIWPGFAINTVFYAAILWLLTLGPFTARRIIRRKRGHCIKCGYDLRGTSGAVCPECGKELCEEVTR